MVRIRRDPLHEGPDLHHRMEEMMEALLRHADAVPYTRGWAPRVDILETGDSTVVTLEIPGVERDGIEIVVQGPYIRVAGVRDQPTPPGCRRWHQMEITYGPFERILSLPHEVDPDLIVATYRDGFLSIEIRRDPVQPRNIPVGGS